MDTRELYLIALETKSIKQANEDLHSFISFLFDKFSVDSDAQIKLIDEWRKANFKTTLIS